MPGRGLVLKGQEAHGLARRVDAVGAPGQRRRPPGRKISTPDGKGAYAEPRGARRSSQASSEACVLPDSSAFLMRNFLVSQLMAVDALLSDWARGRRRP